MGICWSYMSIPLFTNDGFEAESRRRLNDGWMGKVMRLVVLFSLCVWQNMCIFLSILCCVTSPPDRPFLDGGRFLLCL